MGTSKGKKFEKLCTLAEAAGILKAVATALEGGNAPELEEQGLDLKDCAKFKLSLKKKGDTVSVKFKAKAEAAEDDDDDDDEDDDEKTEAAPSYKKLKKRMGDDFKAIGKAIEKNSPPPSKSVSSLLDDARLMTSFAGKGDDQYEAFQKACDAFREAVESADPERIGQAYAELRDRKKQCHALYKDKK